MDLSVITVTWNSAALITEQLISVKGGCTAISFEQLVVDNNSRDATVASINKVPNVQLIANADNKGFSAANNQAAALAHGEFFLFLNPDMRVTPGSLDVMVQWMRQHPTVGLASCKLVDENGRIHADAQPRRFPRLADQLTIILKLQHLFPTLLNRYKANDFNPDVEQPVDSVRGSFMMMRREIYEKLGWAFDPRYVIWFEDVDLCREVQRLGLSVMHTPIISCVDYVGQSFKQRTTLWKQRNFTRSMLTYFKKWEPWYVWLWIALFRPFGIALAWVYDASKPKV